MEKFIKNKGITLIALVITIIVLLILAGISINMLSGENGILSRAVESKDKTIEKQVKEEISIAWNGVQTEGIINRWTINQKAGELQNELRKQDTSTTAKAKGNNVNVKNYKGYDAVINTTNGEFTKFAKSDGETGENNNLILATPIIRETESRAMAIKVSIEVETPPTEEELMEMSQEELKPMFVEAIQQIGVHYSSWSEIPGVTSTTKIEDVFTNFGLSSQYTNAYDLIIKKEGYKVATFTLNDESITGATAEFVVAKNGKYTITATKGEDSGSVEANVTQCKIEEYSEKKNVNTKLKLNASNQLEEVSTEEYDVMIPAGFAYGTSSNVGTLSKGLVITDSVEQIDGKNYSNGNEFVWIPITYTPASEGNDESIVVKGTDKSLAIAKNGTTDGLQNYKGLGGGPFHTFNEPAIVSSDTGDYLSQGVNETVMQGDYNRMINSVKTFGGFYVARYEMGKGENYSKIGAIPTSSDVNDENMWYGLYKKAKEYTKESITAGMIWGSQYEAVLNFGLTNTLDSGKVTQSTNGNHSGKKYKTGSWLGEGSKTDCINNIFDLEGNMSEQTKCAEGSISRVLRGGHFHYSASPSTVTTNGPGDKVGYFGSRISFYINY